MLPANEAYSLLFNDSFLAAFVLAFDYELVFSALIAFGGYGTSKVVAIGFVASMLGFSINYAIGNIMYRLRVYANLSAKEEEKIQKAVNLTKKYGVWVLLFSGSGIFGPIFTILAGLFNVRIPVFLGLTAVGKLASYLFILQ